MTQILNRPSPNWNERPHGIEIDTVVVHATEDASAEISVGWCDDPQAKVSYHSLIDQAATIYTLVPVEKRAWHAGKSEFLGRPNVNDFSIGLSFVNLSDGRAPYADAQLAAGAALVAAWMKRFPTITMDRITDHRTVARPIGRKTDPMPPAFDLSAFKLRVLRELTGGGGCI